MFANSNPCKCWYDSSTINFTAPRIANSNSALWNGVPALFLLALDWYGMVG